MSPSAPQPGSEGQPAHADLSLLLAGIARGSEQDLAALYDCAGPRVYTLARRLLADAQAAEEVTLEVFCQVWEQARLYDPGRGRPEAWLMMLTRSRALDRRRAGAAWRTRALPLDSDERVAGAGSDPQRHAEDGERSAVVHAALAALPAPQRQAIELAFFSGLSHAEIAAQLAEPLGTVKTRVRRGMLRLREALSGPPGQGDA